MIAQISTEPRYEDPVDIEGALWDVWVANPTKRFIDFRLNREHVEMVPTFVILDEVRKIAAECQAVLLHDLTYTIRYQVGTF